MSEEIRLTGQEVYEIVTKKREAPGIHLDYDDIKAAYEYAMQAMDKADNTTVYPLIEITDQMQRERYLASLRVELPSWGAERFTHWLNDTPPPVSPEWEALTEEAQKLLLTIANDESGHADEYDIREFSYRVITGLEDNGYIGGGEDGMSGTIHFLTYKGAMIIPRHLVKAKE